jgi:hypothetical protein
VFCAGNRVNQHWLEELTNREGSKNTLRGFIFILKPL